eukprot:357379_1
MSSMVYNTEAIPKPDASSNVYCLTNIGDRYLLQLGGRGPNGYWHRYFRIYDLQRNEWTVDGPRMLVTRGFFACNVHNNILYAIGGIGNGRHTSVEIIDISNMTQIIGGDLIYSWTLLTDTLSSDKYAARSVVHDDLIYVIGGYDGSWVNEVDVIDTSSYSISVDSYTDNIASLAAVHITDPDQICCFGGGLASGWSDAVFCSLFPTTGPTRSPTNMPTTHPTFDPTQTPTSQPTTFEYNMKYIDNNASCSNLGDHVGLHYDESLSECVDWCTNRYDCTMFNYFEDFKQVNDSRCYIFDTLCDITIDNGRTSVIVYFEFDKQCANYPYNWRDNFGDDCNYYQTYNWCKNKTRLRTDIDFIDLMDSKYELSAIESCCECGGGIRIMDNVAFSMDHWIDFGDVILCKWNH